jgi:hypothetical protein
MQAKQGDEFDSVTEDAIKTHAPIPPMDWPQDQRRAFLGGVYSFRSHADATCPYIDLDCAEAWRKGHEAARREAIHGV